MLLSYKKGERKYKPYYQGIPMRWVTDRNKWYCLQNGEWLDYNDKEENIEWKLN